MVADSLISAAKVCFPHGVDKYVIAVSPKQFVSAINIVSSVFSLAGIIVPWKSNPRLKNIRSLQVGLVSTSSNGAEALLALSRFSELQIKKNINLPI